MQEMISNNAAEASTNRTCSIEQTSKVVKKAKRTVNPFWVKINRARKIFNLQLDKSNNCKLRCLKNEICRESDPQKFYNEFIYHVDWLLDSTKFNDQCKSAEIDPWVLATHVVFLGSASLHKVRENGIYDRTIGGDLGLYKEPFLPDNAQDFARFNA